MRIARSTINVSGLAVVCVLAGCEEIGVDVPVGELDQLETTREGPAIVNDAWRIVKMATAQDIFTIEVEVVDLATSFDVARMLVEPLQERYGEVLVYVYADGEGVGGYVPSKMIHWNLTEGFVEIDD